MVNEFLADLEKLVSIDSGTQTIEGVRQVAQCFERHYQSIGWTAKLVDLGNKAGPGFFATNKPEAQHYDILLNAHMDTVFPEGTAAQRPMTVKGDHAMGPGVADCKGGCLTIFYAIKNTPKEVLDKLSIAVLYNCDEETGSVNSAEWMVSYAKKSDRALIFEPARANGEFVSARKAAGSFTVTFKGLSAHAGNNPEKGHDAIFALTKFINAAKSLEDFDKGITINFGKITAGQSPTIIPDHAETSFRIYCWSDEDFQKTVNQIHELVQLTWIDGVTQTIKELNFAPAMPLNDKTKVMVTQIEKAAHEVGYDDIQWVKTGGISDGNHIASAGIPTLDGMGAAGANLHSDAEYLVISSIEKQVKVASKFLESIK